MRCGAPYIGEALQVIFREGQVEREDLFIIAPSVSFRPRPCPMITPPSLSMLCDLR